MKDWTNTQRMFIAEHLQIDMTANEIARFLRVTTQDIWQLVKEGDWPAKPNMGPIAFHSPGGGNLLWTLGVRGATRQDAYEPMDMETFQRVHRGPGWQP